MNIIKVKDYEEMSQKACSLLLDVVENERKPVLGLATGSTPEGLYRNLIEKYEQHEVTFEDTTTFNLDEYVGLAKDDPNSYRYFMNEKLFKHINIQDENTHVPSGVAEDPKQECKDYEQLIQEADRIDIQILGLGLNGHIGFNEPGTSFSSRTHVVELDESTRNANARFFDSIDDVPTQAITMGIETIMESKSIILLVSGANKAEPLARLVHGEVSEDFPASILQTHGNVTIIADEAARTKIDL
ncbi:glucosamine-6-phosphate deaminase [Ornithinibacillus sp. L9]|uniref:Glucosamine-6-phosphate deaminase n=1 Tax=Ornithinibacillus caprae TaxID=2678566 RepID=A0A6N8FK39_9BACI|nr:glucosamine-6-phosphate deaminase [Ornithinibacillus caprae]MUK89076.1 glucosamine-6-phosphate deaminase [Ornithinibacillus caprae]